MRKRKLDSSTTGLTDILKANKGILSTPYIHPCFPPLLDYNWESTVHFQSTQTPIKMTFEELLTSKNKEDVLRIEIYSDYKGQLDLRCFVNLEGLSCTFSNIESIDVGSLNKLEYIINSKNVKRLIYPKNTNIVG